MAHVSKANGVHDASQAIVLFGLSEEGRPQAGLFAGAQLALAKKAAKQLRLSALCISASQLAGLGAKIPPGRLYANRKSFIPNVRRDVHQKLVDFARGAGGSVASGRGATAGGQPLPPPAGIPKDWDSIAAGHQVIAQSSLADGWWEAIVISRTEEMLTLRWRDYPREPEFKAHFAQVALQKPERAE